MTRSLGVGAAWAPAAWTPPLPGVDLVPVQPAVVLGLVAVSALFHASVFVATPHRAREPYLTKERVASTVHAVLAIAATASWMWYDGMTRLFEPSQLRSGVAGTADEWCAPMLAISTGYFIFDMVVMFAYRETWDLGGVIHHAVIFPSVLLALLGGVSNPLQFIFLLEEMSTPFLNLRSLYRDSGPLYSVFSGLFVLTFLGVRVVWGSYVYYVSMWDYVTHRALALPTPFLNLQCVWQLTMLTISRVLNLYWAALIVRKVLRSGLGRPPAKPTTAPGPASRTKATKAA